MWLDILGCIILALVCAFGLFLMDFLNSGGSEEICELIKDKIKKKDGKYMSLFEIFVCIFLFVDIILNIIYLCINK